MDNVKVICNWTRIGGCEWEKAVQKELIDDEIVKPQIDEILHDDKALLLRRNIPADSSSEDEACEVQLKVFPRYKIAALTIVCTVPKIEVFLGAQDEYYETEHGSLLEEPNDNMYNPRSYRYDIEIEKSGISELTLKLLTGSDEICVFALLLQMAPNPNGITTLLPSGINIENVQKMLESSGQKLAPNAEKCKKLLQMCSKPPAMGVTTSTEALKQQQSMNDAAFEQLKIYIDKRFEDLESKVFKRLDALETQQATKLDEILKTLQNLKT